jgi:hypothetical protein
MNPLNNPLLLSHCVCEPSLARKGPAMRRIADIIYLRENF